jgi:hypothetical protein
MSKLKNLYLVNKLIKYLFYDYFQCLLLIKKYILKTQIRIKH